MISNVTIEMIDMQLKKLDTNSCRHLHHCKNLKEESVINIKNKLNTSSLLSLIILIQLFYPKMKSDFFSQLSATNISILSQSICNLPQVCQWEIK